MFVAYEALTSRIFTKFSDDFLNISEAYQDIFFSNLFATDGSLMIRASEINEDKNW